MQMIWLLGAAAPAKKVHFNLNGSELRGFPIKARSGQSSILYANPLAPKAVARFCLCPAVITGGQCAHGACPSKWPILIPLPVPYPFLSYVRVLHTHIPTLPLTFHLILSFPWLRHSSFPKVLCKWSANPSTGSSWVLALILSLYSDRPAGHTGCNYYSSCCIFNK